MRMAFFCSSLPSNKRQYLHCHYHRQHYYCYDYDCWPYAFNGEFFALFIWYASCNATHTHVRARALTNIRAWTRARTEKLNAKKSSRTRIFWSTNNVAVVVVVIFVQVLRCFAVAVSLIIIIILLFFRHFVYARCELRLNNNHSKFIVANVVGIIGVGGFQCETNIDRLFLLFFFFIPFSLATELIVLLLLPNVMANGWILLLWIENTNSRARTHVFMCKNSSNAFRAETIIIFGYYRFVCASPVTIPVCIFNVWWSLRC